MQKRCGSIYVKGWVGERRRLQESKFKIMKRRQQKKSTRYKNKEASIKWRQVRIYFYLLNFIFGFFFFICLFSFQFLFVFCLFKIVFVIVVCLSPFYSSLFFFTKIFWMIIYDYSGNVWFCEWVFVGNGSAFSNTQSHDILFFPHVVWRKKKKI